MISGGVEDRSGWLPGLFLTSMATLFTQDYKGSNWASFIY